MAEATVDTAMSTHAEASTTAMLSRNDDPMTVALRSEGVLNINELVDLHRRASPLPVIASSSGTLTTPTLFSSRKESTKPTSAGTSYPIDRYNRTEKALVTYASSLSATHGSDSETELNMLRDNALFGVGDWTVDGHTAPQALRGSTKARRRPRQPFGRPKYKKPVIIVQHESGSAAISHDHVSYTKQVHRRNAGNNGNGAKYLRQRRTWLDPDPLALAEEGRFSELSTLRPASRPLSRARYFAIIALVFAIALTIALSAFGAHRTGKAQLRCTKGIIFAASVITSCFTVLAMITARRTLHEALLAGVLEFLIGFALVVEISELM